MYVKWVSCDHGVVHPQVADGENGLQIWRVSSNILHKQLQKAKKGWSSTLMDRVLTPSPWKISMLQNVAWDLGLISYKNPQVH
jgi:hypothetical protein